jgi:hypothetical protein
LQVRFCKFACLWVYEMKKNRKFQINNCKCTIASSQVWNFTKLQNIEIINYKLQILQLNKLQVCICKFVQVFKFTKSRNCNLIITNLQLYKLQTCICMYAKSPQYQVTKYKTTKLQIAHARL